MRKESRWCDFPSEWSSVEDHLLLFTVLAAKCRMHGRTVGGLGSSPQSFVTGALNSSLTDEGLWGDWGHPQTRQVSGFGIRSGDVTERPADGLDGGKAPDPLGERLVSLLPPSSLIQRAGGGGQGFKLGQKILKKYLFSYLAAPDLG